MRALNRDSEAKAVYSKVSTAPGPAVQRSYALQQIAYIDLLHGNASAAEETAQKADQMGKSSNTKSCLAEVEMAKKNYNKAIQFYKDAIDLLSETYPTRADVRQRTKNSMEYHIALCYIFLGELQKGKSMIENIQKANSDLTFEGYFALMGDAAAASAEFENHY